MKKIVLKRITSISVVFVSLCILFTSCSKKEIDSETGTPKLIFKVNGVENPDGFTASGKVASLARNSTNNIDEIKLSKNVSLESYSEMETIPTGFDISNTPSKFDKKLAATSPMEKDVVYRILIYSVNNPNGNPEKTIIAKAQEPIEIDVVKGAQYFWYAYSYNTKNEADLPVPSNLSNPVIETPTDKDLLYASGTVTATSRNTPQPITFKHKVAQIVLELDLDRLFASATAFEAEFNDNYLSKGDFSIKSGTTSNITHYKEHIDLTKFTEDHPTKRNVKVARYYLADPATINSYSLTISKFTVKYLNDTQDDLIEIGDPTKGATFNFTGNGSSLGKQHIGVVKLWYAFPVRKILHVNRDFPLYNYAAQPNRNNPNAPAPSNTHKASYNMIKEPRNYGQLANSKVRSGGFTSIKCEKDGTLHTYLAQNPDITIISVYYKMSSTDITALINYINQGGVVFLMTDGINIFDRDAQQPFFRQLFNNNSITLQNNGYSGGALYKFHDINDEILNGPFGDLRQKFWGEDASPTTSLKNIPASEITYYSDAKAANGIAAASGVTMFKHKRKHFFWIGDGGFLSNEYNGYGSYPSLTIELFATNSSHYPISKRYGYAGNGISAGSTQVWNSVLFANVMSWAIVNAEFFGVNTGGIGNAYVNVP